MGSSQNQSELESRFANLLQPIRDLTKNWDVDIASSLEDYLEELEKVAVTFDGGMTTMNFAEAAMLIQGSVCVYSKKVEYLYTLVYQVLDLLASKKKQGKQSSVDADGNDNDADFNNKNEDEEFLSLDDLQEHKNIVLKEDEYGNKTVMPIPQMPLSLIPLEEGEKGHNPLLSKKGEVLGSRNDFKMNTSSVHHTGTLLLDMSHMALLEKSLAVCRSVQGLDTLQEESTDPCTITEGLGRDNVEEMESNQDPPPTETSVCGIADDGPEPMEDEVNGTLPNNHGESAAELTDMSNFDAQILKRYERRAVKVAPPKPVKDPWEMLDPHSVGKAIERVIKRGKTYKMPPCVEDNPVKKRKRKTPVPVQKLCPLTEFISQTFSNIEKYPKNSLKTISFPELDQQYWAEYKRRQTLLRKERKTVAAYAENDEDEEGEQDDFVGGGDDEDNLLDQPAMTDDRLFEAIDNAVDDDHYSDEGLCGLRGSCTFEEGVIINDYEELVKQHVEQYLASAQEYAQITELSRRVAEWEEKVLPRLEEEDNHEPFDINKYGSLVLDNLDKSTNTSFKMVVRTKPTYEVCRIFLASLMLANTGNVQIVSQGVLENQMDKFELQLLSTKRHFEQLEEYQAPSIAGKS